VKRRFI